MEIAVDDDVKGVAGEPVGAAAQVPLFPLLYAVVVPGND